MNNLPPVLYVEDDENDVFLMERAFKKLGVANPLCVVTDGKMAIDYLGKHKDDGAEGNPCLVLLDLSMPGKNGLDVLKWIRNEPAQVTLPVIVLTSSNQESDIHRAFLLRANGFITKPGDPGKLLNIVKAIEKYWLSGNRPPETFADFAAASNIAVLTHTPAGTGARLNPSLPGDAITRYAE